MHARPIVQQKRHINSRSTVGAHSRILNHKSRLVPSYGSQDAVVKDVVKNDNSIRDRAEQYYSEHR